MRLIALFGLMIFSTEAIIPADAVSYCNNGDTATCCARAVFRKLERSVRKRLRGWMFYNARNVRRTEPNGILFDCYYNQPAIRGSQIAHEIETRLIGVDAEAQDQSFECDPIVFVAMVDPSRTYGACRRRDLVEQQMRRLEQKYGKVTPVSDEVWNELLERPALREPFRQPNIPIFERPYEMHGPMMSSAQISTLRSALTIVCSDTAIA